MKIHHHDDERLVAVCDADILGKKLSHNGVDLHVNDRFYGGLECDLDEVFRELNNCTSFNVFGKNICEILIEEGYVNPLTVLWIEDDGDKVGHSIMVR
jgi:hypothetical protein